MSTTSIAAGVPAFLTYVNNLCLRRLVILLRLSP